MFKLAIDTRVRLNFNIFKLFRSVIDIRHKLSFNGLLFDFNYLFWSIQIKFNDKEREISQNLKLKIFNRWPREAADCPDYFFLQ